MDWLDDNSNFKKAIYSVFALCWAYWIYLFFSTQMTIVFDARGYENLGRMIAHEGWVSYFKDGSSREPFFLASIALSIKLAEVFSVSYYSIQKIIQILFLFYAQILLMCVLVKLNIRRIILVLALLYFGFSPAIINGAFSLFSEIIAYPFVLLTILVVLSSWESIYQSSMRKAFLKSLMAGMCFCLLILGKGAFKYVFVVSLLPFISIALRSIISRDYGTLQKSAIYILTVTFLVLGPIHVIKSLNQTYNGHYTYTGKYNFTFLASSIKRTKPLNKDILLSHIASIPGKGVCLKFYNKKQCDYVGWNGTINSTAKERAQMLKGVDEFNKHKVMATLAISKILENPLQYMLFGFFDGLKMFFWESTRIGFVEYPRWLHNLFVTDLIRYGVRLFLSALTLLAYFNLLRLCIVRRHLFFSREKGGRGRPHHFPTFHFRYCFCGYVLSCLCGNAIFPSHSKPLYCLYSSFDRQSITS